MRNKVVFQKSQIAAYAFTEEVEYMCAEEFVEFPESTTCIISTVMPYQFHEPPVASTAVSTDSVQLQTSPRVTAVHDSCYISISDAELVCAE